MAINFSWGWNGNGPSGVPGEIIKASDALKPTGYAAAVSRAVAYYLGSAQTYVLASLRRSFPNTAQFMAPAPQGLYPRMIKERARAFAGDWSATLTRNGEEVEAAGAVTWESVLDAARFGAVLVEANRLADVAGRVFVRVSWDEKRGRVILRLVTPDRVHLELDPDAVELSDASRVMVELQAVGESRRFEVWTLGDDPQVIQYDERGKELSRAPNPYRAPDGLPDGEPVIPIVGLTTVGAIHGLWPMPNEDMLSAAETADTVATSAVHSLKLNGFGQWVASNSAGTDAEQWPGQVDRGPEAIMIAPRGWQVEHVSQDSQATPSMEFLTRYIGNATAAASLPPGSVLSEGRSQASGVSMLLERQPLDELRADMLTYLTPGVRDLMRAIVIVWNAHQPSNATRFLGCDVSFTSGSMTPPKTDAERADLDEVEIRIGVSSPVRVLMRDEGLTREEAIAKVHEIAEENRVRTAPMLADMPDRVSASDVLDAENNGDGPDAAAPVVGNAPAGNA